MDIPFYVHLIPKAAQEWQPDNRFVRALLVEYFHVKNVLWIGVYSRESHWDNTPEDRGAVKVSESKHTVLYHFGEDPCEIRSERNLDTETALAVLEATNNVLKIINFHSEWNTKVWEELSSMPKSLAEERDCSCDSTLYIGPTSIPDRHRETTAAFANCRLSLATSSIPKGWDSWDKYLDTVTSNHHFVSLKSFLERTSGLEWAYLMGF